MAHTSARFSGEMREHFAPSNHHPLMSHFRTLLYACGLAMAVTNSSPAIEIGSHHDIKFLQEQIARAVSSGQEQAIIQPGTYRGRAEGNVFMTIRGAKNLEVKAAGVIMICEKITRAIEIHECDNLQISGLTVDYDPLPFTQGTIIALDLADKWLDVRIHDGYPVEAYSRIDIVDSKTRHRKHEMPFLWGTKAELRDGGVVRIILEKGFEHCATPGDLASLSTGPEAGGIAHAVEIRNSKRITLRDFTVNSAPGYGIINGGGHGDHHYDNVRVVPGAKPAGATQDRLLSSSWDAIQFNSLRKGPTMENCTVTSAGDDSWSLSSRDYLVLAATGKTVWLVSRVPHEDALEAGDRLARSLDGAKPRIVKIDPKTVPLDQCPVSSGLLERIKGAKPWDYFEFKLQRIRRVELDTDYPWEPGISVYSPDRNCSGFVLRNNTFHSPGRAGLINGASDGLIEGNTYTDCDAVLSLYPNLPAGGATGAENIIFRNNTIRGANNFCPAPWSLGGGAITICHTMPAKQPANAGVFRGITIENNTFENVRGPIFVITSTKGLIISNNRMIHCQHQPHLGSGKEWGVDGAALGWLKKNADVEIFSNEVSKRGAFGTSEAFVIRDQ
jgi:Right handed beta helix region